MAPSVEKLRRAGFEVARQLLDAQGVARVVRRLALQVVERNSGIADLVVVGIRTRGVYLADRMRSVMAEAEGAEPPSGVLDITLYRDDALVGLPDPEVKPTLLEVPIRDKVVLLVDDVLFTGRTVRAALDAIMDFGRPRAIQLAVLVDRGNRELPIGADYVGIHVETDKRRAAVSVQLAEHDGGEDRVVLLTRSPA